MSLVVKNICLRSVVLFICIFSFENLQARTLKELAQVSNLLLVLSDRASSGDHEVKKRSCGLSSKQISARSQKLKAMIDRKIEKLTDSDYRILEKRILNCEVDCTCDIYALAFEKIEKPNEKLNLKASQVKPEDRSSCVSQLSDICKKVRF